MSRKPTLVYFPTRGRGEHVRLLLEVAGVEYVDDRVSWDDWPARKETMPFGQVPYYEDEHVSIAQSMAICRYLANKHGLFGKNDVERANIDALAEAMIDMMNAVRTFLFDQDLDKSPEKQAALADTIKRHYDLFAAALARNGGDGWLVGDSLSWADIAFFGLVDNFARPLARETFNSHPVISAYVQRIKEHPRIAAYLASGRRPACTMPAHRTKYLSTPEACE